MCGWGVSGKYWVCGKYHVWSGCEAKIMCGRVCSKYQVCVVSVCGKYQVWSVCVANIRCGRGVSGERPQSDLEQMLLASQTSH